MRDITDIADVKQRFLGYLTLEKGMSANTAQAYGDDVDKLTRYLADAGVGIESASTDDLERFVSLPWAIYHDKPLWVPPLKKQERNYIN